jgi:hypothetical protein
VSDQFSHPSKTGQIVNPNLFVLDSKLEEKIQSRMTAIGSEFALESNIGSLGVVPKYLTCSTVSQTIVFLTLVTQSYLNKTVFSDVTP